VIDETLKYRIAVAIAGSDSRTLLSHPDGYFAKQTMRAAERVAAMLEENPPGMSLEQAETCAWVMQKNFGMAAILKNLQLVVMRDGRSTLVMPDGSYRVARLGEVHEKPEL
jgi:hypothetical protein